LVKTAERRPGSKDVRMLSVTGGNMRMVQQEFVQ
jgi:hypothetical protein